MTCVNCGEPIHWEPAPAPFDGTWMHDIGGFVCAIEWANRLEWPDNLIVNVRYAKPTEQKENP